MAHLQADPYRYGGINTACVKERRKASLGSVALLVWDKFATRLELKTGEVWSRKPVLYSLITSLLVCKSLG